MRACMRAYLCMQLPCSLFSLECVYVHRFMHVRLLVSLLILLWCVLASVCDISSSVSGDWLRLGLRRAQHSWISKAAKPFRTHVINKTRNKGHVGHSVSARTLGAGRRRSCMCVRVCVHVM